VAPRAPDDLGDLFEGLALDPVQDPCDPRLHRDAVEDAIDREDARAISVGCRIERLGDVEPALEAETPQHGAASKASTRLSHRDPRQPSANRVGVTERANSALRIEKHILHEIVDVRPGAENPHPDPGHVRRVAPENLGNV
jgi:hypothetical protein